jgi:hypothetical protein
MTPATAALLAQVDAAGGELESEGDTLKWRASEPLPAGLLVALKARKGEVLDHLRQVKARRRAAVLNVLHADIRRACDWQELYAVLAEADVRYVHGDIAGDDVDSLCEMARRESLTLPDHAPKAER